MPRDVLLLGSVNLENAEEVFRSVGRILGERVKRIPDGETGPARSYWIQVQTPFFMQHPLIEMVEPDPANPGAFRPARIPANGLYSPTMAGAYRGQAKLRDGADPSALRFDNFGYADWAEESYGVFTRLKQGGAIPRGVRFQVSIPSTGVMLQSRVYGPDVPRIEPAYEAAIFREVERIASFVPRDELAVQWDCTEPVRYESADAAARREMRERMVRLAGAVPELALGLVHFTDGVEGTRRRMETADKFIQGYSIATECGMARRPRETILPLLEIHRQAADL